MSKRFDEKYYLTLLTIQGKHRAFLAIWPFLAILDCRSQQPSLFAKTKMNFHMQIFHSVTVDAQSFSLVEISKRFDEKYYLTLLTIKGKHRAFLAIWPFLAILDCRSQQPSLFAKTKMNFHMQIFHSVTVDAQSLAAFSQTLV